MQRLLRTLLLLLEESPLILQLSIQRRYLRILLLQNALVLLCELVIRAAGLLRIQPLDLLLELHLLLLELNVFALRALICAIVLILLLLQVRIQLCVPLLQFMNLRLQLLDPRLLLLDQIPTRRAGGLRLLCLRGRLPRHLETEVKI